MYQFHKVKLVIWDLDDTLWQGTLSEGTVTVPEVHRELLGLLADCGIVCSVCSKNEYVSTMAYLKEAGLADAFVFPSISWEPKGSRVQQLIEDMQLRPENVLFLDDNPSNLGEARHFCPDIMTGEPDLIPTLFAEAKVAEKKDPEHKRLAQYRVLEEKHRARKEVSSNEAFLYSSGIRVETGSDCLAKLERIHDLILRANQLNFTKVRSSKEELWDLLADPSVSAGYVSVKDRFGDYGITGFYAMKDGKLIHFVFSCRTLGMGIEQYVYNTLSRPVLEIRGEVISDLSSETVPGWINQAETLPAADQMQIRDLAAHAVLVKGPCDLYQVYPYIANTELFDTEFTYVTNSGLTIESTGHTTHVVEALRLSETGKQRVLREVPFTDAGMYCDSIYRKGYKAVFISILADANLGVYRRKGTDERFAFLEYIHPITDQRNWPGLISGEYNHAGFDFTEEILREFSQNYEFIGRNTPEQVVENLSFIRSHLPDDCTLAVMLGGELYYEKNTFEAYRDRHLVHKAMNDAIRSWAEGQKNVRLMDVNKYLTDQSSFYDHFNHYVKPVYYALAAELVQIAGEATGTAIRETARWKMALMWIKEAVYPITKQIKRLLKK